MPEADAKNSWFRSLLEFGDLPIDKRITELMAEELETRPQRIQQAFQAGAKSDFSGKDRQIFDQMWFNQNLNEVNKELTIDFQIELANLAECEEKGIQPGQSLYSLWRNPRLITFYNWFGSKSTQMPNRLTPETERTLLALLWARTRYKNDISVAKKSTWWIAGSENHDLNTKACNL